MRRVLTVLGVLAGLMLASAAPALAGDAEVGMVDTGGGQWHMREPDGRDRTFFFGNPGDVPLLGDWNCDGVDTPAMFRPGTGFVFLTSTNPTGGAATAETSFYFGVAGDIPIAGDWNGDGCDTVGIYRNGRVFLRNSLSTGVADVQFFFGVRGDRPFAGDWNGDGIDTVAIYRDSTGQIFYTNENPVGPVASTANDFFYGIPSDKFMPGDWNGDGVDTVGIFRPSEGRVYLRNSNSTGPADTTFLFGQGSWTPLGGDLELREATLTAPGDTLEVGPVGLGGARTTNLRLSFSGAGDDADLRITSITFGGRDAAEFSAVPLSNPILGPGQSRNIGVVLRPTSLGVKRGFIRIRHTGVGSPLLVNLVGEGSYRVNAGGDPIGDWKADSPYTPGGSVGPAATTSVSGPTAPNQVFQSYRFGQQAWDFPVTPGAYRVNLYFAETFSGTQSVGARQFNVSIEGVRVLSAFDIFAAAGANNGIVRGFDVVSDANLDIDLTQVVNSPAIQGIEIIPRPEWKSLGSSPAEATYGSIAVGDTLRRTITVVHLGEPGTANVSLAKATVVGADSSQFGIISGGSARTLQPGQVSKVVVEYKPTRAGVVDARLYIDHNGPNSPLEVNLIAASDDVILYRLNAGGNAIVGQFSWTPDDPFLVPGTPSGKFSLVEAINTGDQSIPPGTPLNMIRTERYGSTSVPLSYDLPVPNGPYEVRLYFVEGVHNAAGIRVFDVKLEGGLAVNDLDIYARAGKNKAIMIPLQTNVAGGQLDIDLVPIPGKNLPAIHGIEVIKKEGNAVLTSDPVSLTLGPIVTAGTTTGDVAIVNGGGAGIPSVVIQSVAIGGPHAGRFTLLSGPAAGDVLPPGVSDTARIRFTPGWAGDKTGSLIITYNGGRVLTVPIFGSVNNPPVIAVPGTQTVNEGVPFSVTVTATDPDFEFRTMSVTGLPAWASVTGSGNGTITIGGTPGFAAAGTSVVTVTVTDPDGATDSGSFNLTVVNVNRAPTFNTPLLDRANDEGDVVSISTEATDLDGDALTWSATGLPQGITISPTSGLISGTVGFLAFDNQPLAGYYTVDVTVRDNGAPNRSVTDRFLWTISDQNRPPVATAGITATVLEGGSVVVTLTASDPDDDPLTFAAFAPVNGTLGSVVQGAPDQQATVTFTHDDSETTTASFRFNASDAEETSVFATVNLTVTPVNERPVGTSGITATVLEGGSVVVTLTATDPDDDGLTFAAFAPTNGSLGTVVQGSLADQQATVTFTHDGSNTTSASFNFNASDGALTSVNATVNLTVTPVNDRPVATTGITAVVAEGGSVVVSLTATDGDGDPLTFAAFAPTNGSLGAVTSTGPQSANVTFTHNGSETTSASFNFNASDASETSVNATVNLTVTPVNDPPTISNISDPPSFPEGGSTGPLAFTVGDPDTPLGSLVVTRSSSNTTLVPLANVVLGGTNPNRTVTVTGEPGLSGQSTITVSVSDGVNPPVSDTFVVTITPVNDPPVITQGASTSVTMSEDGIPTAFSLTLNATDPDVPAQTLTWSISSPAANGSASASGTGSSKTIGYTPNTNYNGSDSFVVQVSDGNGGTDTITVNVTIEPVNDPPTGLSLSNSTVPAGAASGTAVGTFSTTDVDSASFTYTLVAGAGDTDNASFVIVGDELRTAIAPPLIGPYSIRVQSDDGSGTPFATTFTITVT